MQSKSFRVKEEFYKEELLCIFECLIRLLKENVHERSFHKMYLYWRKFVLESMRHLTKRSTDFQPHAIPDKLNVAFRKPPLYTVGSIWRRSHSRYRKPDRMVPFIRLSGFWLEDYGFHVGKRFEVYPEKSQLVLRVPNIRDMFPSGEMSND